MLLTGCGGTTLADGQSQALVEAGVEISDLQQSNTEYQQLVEDLRQQLGDSEAEIAQLRERAASDDSDPPARLYSGIFSHGPCGNFILAGQRLLKMDYDPLLFPQYEQHETDEVFHEEDEAFFESIHWADTGISLTDNLHTKDDPWLTRPPDLVVPVQVDEDLNHFFYVEWNGQYFEFPEGEASTFLRNWEGIVGANRVSYHGFFGSDSACDWAWVRVAAAESGGAGIFTINSGLEVEPDGTFKAFWWKDYSCGFPPSATAVWDAERHLFVSSCN